MLYSGFIGAYRRNTALLMFFFIVCLLGALALIAGFVVASVGISLAVLHDCQETAGCNASAEAPKDVTIITAIMFAFTVVPLLLNVVGAVLALVTRREILIARAEAATKQSLMEVCSPFSPNLLVVVARPVVDARVPYQEGITIPAEEVEMSPKEAAKEVNIPELPQQQIQYAPMPAFYPPSGQVPPPPPPPTNHNPLPCPQ